jgi:hypothetical protein
MSSIEAALKAIEALEPGEKLVYSQIAAKYGVDRTTLARRHQRVTSSRSIKAQNQQALHPQQEQELLRYIERLASRGVLSTRPMIRRFASDIAKKELGKGWVDRFIQRYQVDRISPWVAGPLPHNPEVVLNRFNQPAQSGQSSDSDFSALSASDGRKIRQLVERAVGDGDQRKISKLNQTVHRLSVRLILAKHENKRLKEALINEKKRKKRGKALPLEADEEYYGESVFWSSGEVEDARDRQNRQGLEEEQQRLQKAEIASDSKDQRQAEKAGRAQKRLQQAQITSKKGKQRSVKASVKAASQRRATAQPQAGGEAAGAAAGSPPSRSRYGRAIKLPSKYK